MIEGGFIFEEAGRFYVPDDLIERLEVHLEEAGCNYRERKRGRDYARDREAYAERLAERLEVQEQRHQQRLSEEARACGVEVSEASQQRVDTLCESAEGPRRAERAGGSSGA